MHLDLDMLVVHPLDELYDVMHFGEYMAEERAERERLREVTSA